MVYLMRQTEYDNYYILDLERDYIGSMHNGIPSIIHTECLYSEKCIKDLLLSIQASKDYRWYVVLDSIDSNGKMRHDEYPNHCELRRLVGYIPKVCGIRIDDSPYLANWQVDYLSELWVRNTENSIIKVANFTEVREKEVKQFLHAHNLQPQYSEHNDV